MYIERFLDAMTPDLRDALGEGEAARTREEIRAHLAESAAELRTQGHTPEEAERIAIERFGDAKRLSGDLLEARQPGARWAGLGTIGAAFLLSFMPLAGMLHVGRLDLPSPWRQLPEPTPFAVILLAALFGFGACGARCRAWKLTRASLLGSAFAVLGMVLASVYWEAWSVAPGAPEPAVSYAVQTERLLAKAERNLRAARHEPEAGPIDLDYPAGPITHRIGPWSDSTFYPGDRRALTPEESEAGWRKHGPGRVEHLRRQLEMERPRSLPSPWMMLVLGIPLGVLRYGVPSLALALAAYFGGVGLGRRLRRKGPKDRAHTA